MKSNLEIKIDLAYSTYECSQGYDKEEAAKEYLDLLSYHYNTYRFAREKKLLDADIQKQLAQVHGIRKYYKNDSEVVAGVLSVYAEVLAMGYYNQMVVNIMPELDTIPRDVKNDANVMDVYYNVKLICIYVLQDETYPEFSQTFEEYMKLYMQMGSRSKSDWFSYTVCYFGYRDFDFINIKRIYRYLLVLAIKQSGAEENFYEVLDRVTKRIKYLISSAQVDEQRDKRAMEVLTIIRHFMDNETKRWVTRAFDDIHDFIRDLWEISTKSYDVLDLYLKTEEALFHRCDVDEKIKIYNRANEIFLSNPDYRQNMSCSATMGRLKDYFDRKQEAEKKRKDELENRPLDLSELADLMEDVTEPTGSTEVTQKSVLRKGKRGLGTIAITFAVILVLGVGSIAFLLKSGKDNGRYKEKDNRTETQTKGDAAGETEPAEGTAPVSGNIASENSGESQKADDSENPVVNVRTIRYKKNTDSFVSIDGVEETVYNIDTVNPFSFGIYHAAGGFAYPTGLYTDYEKKEEGIADITKTHRFTGSDGSKLEVITYSASKSGAELFQILFDKVPFDKGAVSEQGENYYCAVYNDNGMVVQELMHVIDYCSYTMRITYPEPTDEADAKVKEYYAKCMMKMCNFGLDEEKESLLWE